MKEDRILDIDFQGWPVERKTLRELLLEIGAKEIETPSGKMLGFSNDSKLLDVYPRTLEDDGMGYGIKEMWFTSADVGVDCNDEKYINFFREYDHFSKESGYEDK